MDILIALFIVVIIFSILGFIFRSAIRLFLVVGVISALFVLFFSDGTSIVNKLTPFLNEETGKTVEEFYADFRSKADEKSLVDAEKLISSIKEHVPGKINEEKLKEDLRAYAENNLTEEKLNEGVTIIKKSIEEETITEDLINFIKDNFTEEKADAFLVIIREYFI